MSLRKPFFWLHLIAGSVAGLVILIMSLTGVLLMYEKQMVSWLDQRGFPPLSGPSRLPLDELIVKVRDARRAMPSTVTFRSEASAPVMFGFGRDAVYADPYTGRILGEGCKTARSFFRVVTD